MISKQSRVAVAVLVLGVSALPIAQAAPLDQYASSVLDVSSQWSGGSWSAAQALDVPNTFGYGDIASAWAPGPRDGTLEFITLGYDTPIYASGAVIRETWGNGFVYQVDVLDTNNLLHTVFAGVDPSQPGAPADFTLAWAPTSFLVKGLKVYTDTNHDLSAWEEIDSVQLRGDTVAPVPLPGAAWLLGSALAGAGACGRRRRA